MPIHEFKCLKCGEYFELLLMCKDDKSSVQCPKCSSNDFERIISATNCVIGRSGQPSKASVEVKTCSTGSCTTYDVPGPA